MCKALTEATHCILDNIRSLMRMLRRRKLDTREKTGKDTPFQCAWDLPRPWRERGRVW